MQIFSRLKILHLAIFIVALSGCIPSQPEKDVNFFYRATADISNWNDLFADQQIIDIQFPDTSEVPLSIRGLVVGKDGNFFIPDAEHHRILEFDSLGVLRRMIRKHGREPGEFSILVALQLDAQDNLHVFDLADRRMTIFKAPDYQYAKTFTISSNVTHFLVGSQDHFLIYSLYNEKIIRRYDSQGNLLGETLEFKQNNLRLFLSRFQTGGLVSDQNGGGFYTIFPEDFYIYHYDNNLKLMNLLQGEISSPWRPVSPPFPKELSPYKYNLPHQKWWDSFLHINQIYLLSDQVLAVTLFESYNLNFEKTFLNLYSTDGAIIVEGLPIPQGAQIVAMGNDAVYLATDALLLEDGSIRPVQLRKYTYTGLLAKPKYSTSTQSS